MGIMNGLNIEELKEMFGFVADSMIRAEAYLTEIDQEIGDGDHGIGMARGFRTVKEQLPVLKETSVNEVFKNVGMLLLDSMGGASGVIFGTMFISGYGAVPAIKVLELEQLGQMFQVSLENIKKRGKGRIGDKTMIDSFEPAVHALLQSARSRDSLLEGLKKAAISAKEGADQTKEIVAKMGRAESYQESSIGIPDPGAVSVSIIFASMYEYVLKTKGGQA